MEPEGSLPRSQKLANALYPDPGYYSQQIPTLFP